MLFRVKKMEEKIMDILTRYDHRVMMILLLVVVVVSLAYILKKTNIIFSVTISALSVLGIVFEHNTMFGIHEWADWYLSKNQEAMALIQQENKIWWITLLLSITCIVIQITLCGYRIYKKKNNQ